MTDEEAIKGLQNIVEYWTIHPHEQECAETAISALRERIERNQNASEFDQHLSEQMKYPEFQKEWDSLYNEGWISVKDNLPEKYGTYLVYLGMPDKLIYGSGVHTAWYYDGSKEFSFSLNTAKMLGENDSTKIRSASVTHWMPLPEPPKEEKP